MRSLRGLVAAAEAGGGNPASAPNYQRLLSGTLQTQEIRPGEKKVFGKERCPVADVFHAFDDVIFF